MTPAVLALEQAGVNFNLHQFDNKVADNFALHAASELQLPPQVIFKTLLAADDQQQLYVALIPAHTTLVEKALAKAIGCKRISMATVQAAQAATGYVVGAISPFGQRQRLPVFADNSLSEHTTVFVSGGRRGLEIEIAPADLLQMCNARLAALARSGGPD